jgi:hypothetical protein
MTSEAAALCFNLIGITRMYGYAARFASFDGQTGAQTAPWLSEVAHPFFPGKSLLTTEMHEDGRFRSRLERRAAERAGGL